ncbi:HNH endonuclease [Vibrio breoganii]
MIKAMANTYIFQGNPKHYDMDTYLATHPYIYWRCPSYKDKIQIGDIAILWRAGKDAGMIAIGEIVEAPTSASSIKFPELLGQRFWASDEMDVNDIKVGIAISEVRLIADERSVSRQHFKTDTVVSKHRIITNPTGTVFQVEDTIANTMFSAWNNSGDSGAETDELTPSKVTDSEGKYRYVLHKRRERSSALRKAKIKHFLTTNEFIHCQLCRINLNEKYPRSLSEGYIEVHHIKPISTLAEHTPTNIDDLILLCPNCHRMVHRTKDAEKNLEDLKKWFVDE